MHPLTSLIQSDMKPAFGVTEPGAIAYATALAKSYTKGELKAIHLSLNSGMYKNAFTCGIPNTDQIGNLYAAALGAAVNMPDFGLEMLSKVGETHRKQAEEWVKAGMISATVAMVSSRIYIQARVEAGEDVCTVTIRDKHTQVEEIRLNEAVLCWTKVNEEPAEESEDAGDKDKGVNVHDYSFQQMIEFAETVDLSEILFLKAAYDMNIELFQLGLSSSRTTFAPSLHQQNGCQVISKNERATAQLLCNGAIEARVIGLEKPAMSIAGSGAHGIICTMPLYAVQQVNGLSEEKLLRATAISYLITEYIKEYSGRLSAFCGCGVASGTAMACAMAWLKGASLEQIEKVVYNMASGITGMICDGGNQGCTMKGIVAVDAAFRAVEFAMMNVAVDSRHGINGATPEDTFRQMGLIASPGMEATEKTIVEIMENKKI